MLFRRKMAPKATPSKPPSTPDRVKTKGVVKKKRKGRLSNQALRRISDSSFNVAQLSGSRISTPRDRNKKRLRSNLLTGANNPGSSRYLMIILMGGGVPHIVRQYFE